MSVVISKVSNGWRVVTSGSLWNHTLLLPGRRSFVSPRDSPGVERRHASSTSEDILSPIHPQKNQRSETNQEGTKFLKRNSIDNKKYNCLIPSTKVAIFNALLHTYLEKFLTLRSFSLPTWPLEGWNKLDMLNCTMSIIQTAIQTFEVRSILLQTIFLDSWGYLTRMFYPKISTDVIC